MLNTLRWYLGKEDVSRSFEAPLLKFQDRVQEVVEGSAPLYLAIQRYNQRAVSVLSYVSQFAVSEADLASLQQTALHKVFRLPPNSSSREASTNVGLYTGVDPISLPEYCAAVRCRFAFSER